MLMTTTAANMQECQVWLPKILQLFNGLFSHSILYIIAWKELERDPLKQSPQNNSKIWQGPSAI